MTIRIYIQEIRSLLEAYYGRKPYGHGFHGVLFSRAELSCRYNSCFRSSLKPLTDFAE